jgi:dTDP-4-dehydrorhamnose reductase
MTPTPILRPMAKTILIIGADGTIGRALLSAAALQGHTVTGTTRRPASAPLLHADLEDSDLRHMPLPAADIAFFCAAMASFADCRLNPARARQINVIGPEILAGRLVAQGTRVVALSSSSVFDWSTPRVSADKPPCPTSVYGQMKAENEASFLRFGDAATIVRFAKVLDADNKLFANWFGALTSEQPITAFSDLRMAPVALNDAVKLLLTIATADTSGIYQYSARDDISYRDAALHFAKALGRSPALVLDGSARDHGIPAEEITTCSSMDSIRAETLLDRPAPDSRETLDQIFRLHAERARTAEAVRD